MKKKVIFIGGTSHSGSTVLDLILSNHPKAMSLGEIKALMKPSRPHHFEKRKNLINNCEKWKKIIKGGSSNLYKNLIEEFNEKQFFIDSSKDPIWIVKQQNKIDKISNVDYKNVLIYKTPLEFAHSFHKRGRDFNWSYAWKHYHRFYFSMLNQFLIVSYKDVCLTKSTIELLRQFNDIDFDTKKIIAEQENFFGSTNQKKLKQNNEILKYSEINDEELQFKVQKVIENDKRLKGIHEFLQEMKNTEMIDQTDLINNLKYSEIMKKYLMFRKETRQSLRRYFPDHNWNK